MHCRDDDPQIRMRMVDRINLSIHFSSKNIDVNHHDDIYVFKNFRSFSSLGTMVVSHARLCDQPIGVSEA